MQKIVATRLVERAKIKSSTGVSGGKEPLSQTRGLSLGESLHLGLKFLVNILVHNRIERQGEVSLQGHSSLEHLTLWDGDHVANRVSLVRFKYRLHPVELIH
jgi:hypothetical protein